MKATKLFLVAVDGSEPWDWRPFGTLTLRQLSQKFKEEIENKHCSRNFELEITAMNVDTLEDSVLPRVVGCIVDVGSFNNGGVADKFRSFSFKIRRKREHMRAMPLYLLSNVSSRHASAGNLMTLRGQLALSGYRANDVHLHPMTEDEDIQNAMAIIAVNIATNELLHDSLELG